MQVIIDTAGTSISVKNKCFFIKNETDQKLISPNRITSLAIMTNCDINSSAIKLAVQNQIGVMFFNRYGNIQARMYSPYFTNLAELRKKQLIYSTTTYATSWIVDTLLKKNGEQTLTLEMIKRKKPSVKDSIDKLIVQINTHSDSLNPLRNQRLDSVRQKIMGIEGIVSKLYFGGINLQLPNEFQFEKRSRRPAQDFFNAGLNYLYGMTYSVVESGIFAKGLDPSIGLMHVDQHSRPTLAYDMIEPFRLIVDRLLIDLISDKKLEASHFDKKNDGFWVNKEGKRILIVAFQNHLQKRIQYDGKVKRLKDHIYESSNLLAKDIESKINLEHVSYLL